MICFIPGFSDKIGSIILLWFSVQAKEDAKAMLREIRSVQQHEDNLQSMEADRGSP